MLRKDTLVSGSQNLMQQGHLVIIVAVQDERSELKQVQQKGKERERIPRH